VHPLDVPTSKNPLNALLSFFIFKFFFLDYEIFFHESYEGVKRGIEYGVRNVDRPSICGRQMLKMTDNNNIPWLGGQTTDKYGVTPVYYDVKRFNWVI